MVSLKIAREVRNAGPRITTSRAGKMQNSSGKISLMVVFAAASSARWMRSVRRQSE
jgi:hypothetical protein